MNPVSVLNITLLYGLNIKEPDIDTFDVFESSSIQFIHEQTLFLFPRTGGNKRNCFFVFM